MNWNQWVKQAPSKPELNPLLEMTADRTSARGAPSSDPRNLWHRLDLGPPRGIKNFLVEFENCPPVLGGRASYAFDVSV